MSKKLFNFYLDDDTKFKVMKKLADEFGEENIHAKTKVERVYKTKLKMIAKNRFHKKTFLPVLG